VQAPSAQIFRSSEKGYAQFSALYVRRMKYSLRDTNAYAMESNREISVPVLLHKFCARGLDAIKSTRDEFICTTLQKIPMDATNRSASHNMRASCKLSVPE
jgi:hypothetical protein